MRAYLSKIGSSCWERSFRHIAKQVAQRLPKPLERTAKRAEEFARGLVTGGTLFEELGFLYVGPVDGHNLDHLLPVLRNLRDTPGDGPVLLHVVTETGRGHPFPESSADKYPAAPTSTLVTRAPANPKANPP